MFPALSVVAGSYSRKLSWLVTLGLMNTLTEVTSAVCMISIAWRCDVRVMVIKQAGKESLVDVGAFGQ